MRRPPGFSFAEVLVAIGILSMAVLALISVQLFGMQAGNRGRERHRAAVLAAERMDLVESQLRSSAEDFALDHTLPRTAVPGQPGYFWAQADELESANLKRITVSLYWEEHEFALRTLVYRRP